MNKEQKIKVAIVGAGYWGPNLVRNFYQLEDAEVEMVCDIKEEKLKLVKKNYPTIKTTTNFNGILENPEIMAVAIAVPAELHYQFSKKVLEAGKHVLVEKPISQTSREVQELIELAKANDKILMVDHSFLYYGPVLKIKEIIDSGELGKVYYFDSQRVNLGLIRKDVNVIWDLASHDISIINFLIKKQPIAVSAWGVSHIAGKSEDLAHITLKYPDDFVAHIHVSWLSPVKIRQILIGASKKMILFDDIQPSEKIKIYDTRIEIDPTKETPFEPIYRTGEVRIPIFDQAEALEKECQHFIQCIKENKTPLTDGKNGLEVVKILEACDRSLKEKGKETKII